MAWERLKGRDSASVNAFLAARPRLRPVETGAKLYMVIRSGGESSRSPSFYVRPEPDDTRRVLNVRGEEGEEEEEEKTRSFVALTQLSFRRKGSECELQPREKKSPLESRRTLAVFLLELFYRNEAGF